MSATSVSTRPVAHFGFLRVLISRERLAPPSRLLCGLRSIAMAWRSRSAPRMGWSAPIIRFDLGSRQVFFFKTEFSDSPDPISALNLQTKIRVCAHQ
jgi:hypothetical protein